MTGNFDEIRMEITSCFVRKHEYWVKRGKNWIARITGLDTRYGYKREFLETTRIGREKVFLLEDFHVGEIYEIASIYTSSGTIKGLKDTFVCTEITQTHVVLECIPQEEVLKRYTDQKENVAAQNLVQQLLKIVTKDEAVELIQVYG
ncbi:MAG: hypothetical protein HXS48_11195 [Theionarchaea archaeon]|nr:hypothetical protein [Theionarchaea archaeon]